MRFLRWKETRPKASMIAVSAWILGLLLIAEMSQTLKETMPLLVMWIASALPLLAMLLPALLAYVALRAGRLPALVCTAAGVLVCGIVLSTNAALLASLLLVPSAAFSVYSYERKLPFWQSVGVNTAMLLGTGILMLWILNSMSGGDAIVTLRALLDPLVRDAPETDRTLLWLASMGYVRIPDVVLPGMQLGPAALDGPVREELIKQFMFSSESLLRQSLPNQVLRGVIYSGVLSVAWPRRVAARHANEMEPAPMPPLHEWYIPIRLFRPLVFTVLGAGLLMFLSGSRAMVNLVNVLWSGVSAVIALQGGALLAFMMRKGGVRASLRMAAVVALLYVLNYVMVLLGFADQFFNSRMLRKPPGDHPFHKRDEEGER